MNAVLKKSLGLLAILALGGAVRLPIEFFLTKNYRDARLLDPRLPLAARDKLGQDAFLAAIGGYRSLVASVQAIESVGDWANLRWDKVDQRYSLCCMLQPREERYWTVHAWMMGKNAAEHYATDDGASAILGRDLRQFYLNRGIAIAEAGTRNIPDSYELWRQLAHFYQDAVNREPNPDKSAECYLRAYACPGAPRYLYRHAIYQIAKVPGREAEAYGKLMELYHNGGLDRPPTVVTLINELQTKLGIPRKEWIPEKGGPARTAPPRDATVPDFLQQP